MNKNIIPLSKVSVLLMATALFSVLVIVLPELAREEAAGKANPPITWPFYLGAWVGAIPIFTALYHTQKLITLIDKSKAFSHRAVKELQLIKQCAWIFAGLVLIGVTSLVAWLKFFNPEELDPSFIMLGSILIFISTVVASFIAVLQRLLTEAIKMKQENDLIV